MTLIGAAKEHGIEFIYAISPGLDITFSNQKEVSALKRKLDQVFTLPWIAGRLLRPIHVKLLFSFVCQYHFQVTHFGCKSFALLFDDIDHNMCPADKEVFSSFAHAQVSITNEIFQYLGEPETFLFCPTGTHIHHRLFSYFQSLMLILPCHFISSCWNTEYCGTFCYPNVAQSPYLHTVGEKLLPGIDILWTGEFDAWPVFTLKKHQCRWRSFGTMLICIKVGSHYVLISSPQIGFTVIFPSYVWCKTVNIKTILFCKYYVGYCSLSWQVQKWCLKI